MKTYLRLICLALALLAPSLHAQEVVINEIFYHAPGDIKDLQWIELHNPTDQPVRLAGWSFTKGIKFKFPAGATIAPHSYAVICRNRESFRHYYDTAVMGEFSQALKKSGERLELSNALARWLMP
jgi:hypothetical protein